MDIVVKESYRLKKTKIIFFIYRLGGGGAARTILNIINNIDKDKYEPILVTLNFNYDYESFVANNVKFIKLETKRLRSAILQLAKLLKEEKPDILFSTVITYNIVATLAKMISRVKVKLILREAALLTGTSKSERRKLNFAKKLYKKADAVVSLSEGVKSNLIEHYNVKENKIHVIYNPVDLEHITEEKIEKLPGNFGNIRARYDYVLVSAGRFVKEKDQMTLIKAFANIQKDYSACLILLGEGELEAQLKEEVQALNIKRDVYFVGFQQNPYQFFNMADIFVLTSLTEGFGHVFVEALATEALVVTTDCKPGSQEVLAGGKYGYIAKVADVQDVTEKIKEALVLPNDEKAERIKEGLERAQQFDAKKIVKQYEALFDQVLKED